MTPELQKVLQAFANQYSVEFTLNKINGVAISPELVFAPVGEFVKDLPLNENPMSEEQDVTPEVTPPVAPETTPTAEPSVEGTPEAPAQEEVV